MWRVIEFLELLHLHALCLKDRIPVESVPTDGQNDLGCQAGVCGELYPVAVTSSGASFGIGTALRVSGKGVL